MSERQRKTITIRLRGEDYETLARLAKKVELSPTGFARRILEKSIGEVLAVDTLVETMP